MKKKLSKLATMVLPFLAAPFIVNAEYVPERDIHLYFSGPSGSYHYNREAESNEKNWIWGIGIPFKNVNKFGIRDIEAFAFHCTNSEGHPSTAIGANLKFGCTNTPLKVCWGLGVGGVDGYKSNDYKFELSKYPFPNLSLSYKNFRFNSYISNVVIMYSFGVEIPIQLK